MKVLRIKRVIGVIMALLLIISSGLPKSLNKVKAAGEGIELVYSGTDERYTWVQNLILSEESGGKSYIRDVKGVYMILDGEKVFCLQVGSPTSWSEAPDQGYKEGENDFINKLTSNSNLINKIELGTYFGWTKSEQSIEDYMFTQRLIWDLIRDEYGNIKTVRDHTVISFDFKYEDVEASYQSWKKSILSNINEVSTNISFNNKTFVLEPGSIIEIEDTNLAINQFSFNNLSKDGVTVSNKENKLIISASEDAVQNKEINFTLNREVFMDYTSSNNIFYVGAFYNDKIQAIGNIKSVKINDNFINVLVKENRGELLIKKTDSETNQAIKASFKILDEQSSVLNFEKISEGKYKFITSDGEQALTTDSNGNLSISEILFGKYQIQEISSSDGYILDKQTHSIEVETSNSPVELNITNKPQKGILTLDKKGIMPIGIETVDKLGYEITQIKYGQSYLADSKWKLIAKEDIYSLDGKTLLIKKGDVADTIVTNSQGPVTSKAVPLGKYTLKEIDAPKAYLVDTSEYNIEFTSQSNELEFHQIIDSKLNNRKSFSLGMTKNFEESKYFTNKKEAIFGLYNAEDYSENGVDIKKDSLLDVVSFNPEGAENKVNNKFDKILIDGNFYIKELNTSESYKLLDKKIDINIDFSNNSANTDIILENEIDNKLAKTFINITKHQMGSEENPIVVSGAKYRLVSTDPFKGNIIIGEYVTDENGSIRVDNLDLGKYYLEEISPANGYLLNPEIIDIDLTKETSKTNNDIIVKDEKYVELKTTASDENGNKELLPLNQVSIIDKVQMSGLIPGEEYVLEGKLIDKISGKPLTQEGKALVVSKAFIAEDINQNLDIKFEVNASDLSGKELVVFEKLTRNNILVGVHEDINDLGQTIKIVKPKIKTNASDGYNNKLIDAKEDALIVDKVEYSGLVKGKEYILKGKLIDKETGNVLMINDREINSEIKFVADESDGFIELEFKVDTRDLEGKKLVAFENLYYQDSILAAHEDINDQDQTIEVEDIVVVIEKLKRYNPKTGDSSLNNFFLIILFSMVLVCLMKIAKNKAFR